MKNPAGVTAAGSDADLPWTTVIGAKRHLLDVRLDELWRSRDLIALFIRRDFVAVYKQTILGPLWHILQPVMTTVAFTIVFGRIAGLSTNGLPPFLFYMAGTVLWTYFSTVLSKNAIVFVANADLYGKVYFHRLAIPVSLVVSSLISFAIQLGLFLVLLAIFIASGSQVRPNTGVFLLPLLVLMMAGYGLALGIVVSSLTTRYRDLTHVVSFGVQLWMYATPIIYPVSAVPAKYLPLIMLNPMTSILEAFRYGFLGVGMLSSGGLAYSAVVLVVLLYVGLLLFNRVEQTFMDTV